MAEIRVDRTSGRNLTWLWILLAVLVVAGVAGWWLYQSGTIQLSGVLQMGGWHGT